MRSSSIAGLELGLFDINLVIFLQKKEVEELPDINDNMNVRLCVMVTCGLIDGYCKIPGNGTRFTMRPSL